MEGGEHGIVSSLTDKHFELRYESLLTFLVVKLSEQNKIRLAPIFWLVEFERSGRISEFDSM